MARKMYRNGDDITLQLNGCDGCRPAMINKVLCHETGCPDAWRDYQIDCFECGYSFYPQERYDRVCKDCTNFFEEAWDGRTQTEVS